VNSFRCFDPVVEVVTRVKFIHHSLLPMLLLREGKNDARSMVVAFQLAGGCRFIFDV
jgi:hypothetical protein